MRHLGNNKGYALIGSIFLIMTLGYVGVSVVELASTDSKTSIYEVHKNRAKNIHNAGLEWASNRIDNGLSANTNGKAFAGGTFDVTTDPSNGTITVTGYYGDTKYSSTIDRNFAKDCIDIDSSEVTIESMELQNVKVIKSCNTAATLVDMVLEYNFGDCNGGDKKCGDEYDANGTYLQKISLSQQDIFKVGEVPNESVTQKTTGDEIDVLDATMSVSSNYYFNSILFDKEIPTSSSYTMTLNFADGSSKERSFLVVHNKNNTINNQSFDVEGGSVTIQHNKNVNVKVVGSAITCGSNGPEVPVTVELGVDGVYTTLFNGSDVDGGETYDTSTSDAAHEYTIRSTAASQSCGNFSRTLTSTDSSHVKTLKNGDNAPALEGFGGQKAVTEFLEPYLNNAGKIVLNSNQVIQLWELGVDLSQNPESSAADFQDLVVLYTIDEN